MKKFVIISILIFVNILCGCSGEFIKIQPGTYITDDINFIDSSEIYFESARLVISETDEEPESEHNYLYNAGNVLLFNIFITTEGIEQELELYFNASKENFFKIQTTDGFFSFHFDMKSNDKPLLTGMKVILSKIGTPNIKLATFELTRVNEN